MAILEPGVQLCGRFTLIARIGSGGHGEVWRVQDAVKQTEVALKILHPQVARSPEAWESLRREHAIAQRLSHPRIAEIGEPLRDDTATVLPMTLATGDLRRLRGEPYTRILPALMEIAAALQHAHERGVVHRDLKPSNVLIDDEGHIAVSDFGVAALDTEPPTHGVGSPFSVSPQQLQGAQPTPADDIYGLGSLAYELLSGYPPFYPNFDARTVLEQPAPELLPIHPAPPRLSALIMAMLAKDPAERPADMNGVIAELELALRDTLDEGLQADAAPAGLRRSQSSADLAASGIALDRDTDFAPVSPPDAIAPDAIELDDSPVATLAGASEEPLAIEASSDGAFEATSVLPPERSRRSPGLWLGLGALAAGVAAVFILLPRFAPQTAVPVTPSTASPPIEKDDGAKVNAEARMAQQRALDELKTRFDTSLAALEARGAAVWGGPLFAAARALAADADAARRAGNLELAKDRAETAQRRLDRVAEEAKAALEAQLAEGERALAAGQTPVAQQAFTLAAQIDPSNAKAREGLQRAGGLDTLLPVLTAASNAATAREFAQAISLFEQVLRADPANVAARDGLAAVRAAAGNDAYARAIGDALAAIRGGRLDVARTALERARTLRPNAPEVVAGLAELNSSQVGQQLASVKAGAEALETAERWADALGEYQRVLAADASLEFARQGRDRVAPRAELAARLQGLIDQPSRLASPEVRLEADRLLIRARAVVGAGPVLRSQISRLELALPAWDQPVKLLLESDGQTAVTIQRVADYGGFESREIELKPGRYTLIGTRSGFRDVRREVVVAPGTDTQRVQIRCTDPI